jgi:hypothetical protein
MQQRFLWASAALATAVLVSPAWADAETAWLIKQQRGDGSWANANGEQPVQATSAALQALQGAGLSRSPSLRAATSWLANADADSVDSIARKAAALAGSGLAASSQTAANQLYALRTLNSTASWGGYGSAATDFVDTALGLAALRVADSNYATRFNTTVLSAYCEAVTSRVVVASGKAAWPLTRAATNQSAVQGRPSVLATGLMLTELRSIQRTMPTFGGATCGSTSYALTAVILEAQAWLLDQQNTNGGFGEPRSDGSKGLSSAPVTAVVLRGLNSLTTVPQTQTTSAQTWLLSQQDATAGSWRGDAFVTALAVASLPAATGAQLADTDQDGISDVVEAYLGSNPNLADARNPLGPPGLGSPGTNSTAFVVGATVGQAFAYSLSSGSNYRLSAGSLPPGLSLNGTSGQIGGTPTTVGSYAFDYAVTTAAGPGTVIGRIDVVQAVASNPDADIPIPLWALGILGAALLRFTLRPSKP